MLVRRIEDSHVHGPLHQRHMTRICGNLASITGPPVETNHTVNRRSLPERALAPRQVSNPFDVGEFDLKDAGDHFLGINVAEHGVFTFDHAATSRSPSHTRHVSDAPACTCSD